MNTQHIIAGRRRHDRRNLPAAHYSIFLSSHGTAWIEAFDHALDVMLAYDKNPHTTPYVLVFHRIEARNAQRGLSYLYKLLLDSYQSDLFHLVLDWWYYPPSDAGYGDLVVGFDHPGLYELAL